MKIHHRREKEVSVITLGGRLDAQTVPSFKEEVFVLLQGEKPQCIIDLGCLEFIDSTGLGALISLLRKIEEREGKLVLTQLQPEVASIFEITRLHKLFKISLTLNQALKEF